MNELVGTCAAHPRYAAVHKPVSTDKYPDGCPVCWEIWSRQSQADNLIDALKTELMGTRPLSIFGR